MFVDIEDWKNGWLGLEIGLKPNEIDKMIELLTTLKHDHEQHFHITSNYKGEGGIGDIEIFVQDEKIKDSMHFLGEALPPGTEI